ncbi:MAG: peptidase transporter [Mucilaginibacter sp.]|nr:peptidase transporter [Mucilaginibacter sp.]
MNRLLQFFSKRQLVFQQQHDVMDCGSACLKMIAEFYGKRYSLEYLRTISYLGKEGISLLNLSNAAEEIGLTTLRAKLTLKVLVDDCPLPCILHWNQDHFVVLQEIRTSLFKPSKLKIKIADPAHGIVTIDKDSFLKSWLSTAEDKGTALLLEPTPEFYRKKGITNNAKGFKFLFRYLQPHRRYVIQLAIGMLATSLISLTFPFLTQLLIDYGVHDSNLHIVYLLLLSQLFLFIGNVLIDIIQNWLLLHVNVRVSLNIISDFLLKLLKLPIKFFDTKAVGDITQRINDHHRIETFLTGVTLTTLFSLINIVVFAVVLGLYNSLILFVFVIFSLLAVSWIFLFQRKRKQLDYKRFARNKENQDKLFEMITGMQEIKLYGSEKAKRWEWESLQVKVFKLNLKSLALEQNQKAGYLFLSQLKNILISFLAARAVINGQLSLGMLLSISYIIGQTNGPLEQLVAFFKAAQDARLSLERMNEIHNSQEEEPDKMEVNPKPVTMGFNEYKRDIILENISFQYEGPHSPFVLKDIDFTIPEGKVTAIVGTSGSGKTTLIKLILGFYRPTSGVIYVGNTHLNHISPREWRSRCGTVMQDGYIFSDTIARNIALDGENIDDERMQQAVNAANIKEFIESCPLSYTTKIGNNGTGISGGQKQRIFIARAIYKNPSYLFLDEATSNLDANNERKIMENFDQLFKGKTVIVIAHRLSTVKNADQIIVLDNGKIVEKGSHVSLVRNRNCYYQLVKNQLELEG